VRVGQQQPLAGGAGDGKASGGALGLRVHLPGLGEVGAAGCGLGRGGGRGGGVGASKECKFKIGWMCRGRD
jgi:hypothetical protein